jgi:hypothetical protein
LLKEIIITMNKELSRDAKRIADAAEQYAREFGIDGDVFVTTPTESGVITSGFDEKGTPLWGPEWEAAQSNNS